MDPDWNVIVADLGPRLYRYFRSHCPQNEAADLTQDTLVRLVRKVRDGQFDPERGNLRMYAFGIAHFVAMEAGKSNSPVHPVSEIDSEDKMESDFIDKEDAQLARAALQRLPQIQQQILTLMIDKEMSLNDIAILLEIPVGTIKSHIFRAKERLREILGEKRELL